MARPIFDLQPMSIGDILDRAIRLYRRAFLHNLAIVAVPYIVLIPATLLMGSKLLSGQDPRLLLRAHVAIPGVLLVLVYVWLLFMSMGALARSVSDQFLRETPTVAASYGVVFRRTHSLVWAYFLASLVYGGLALLVVVSAGLTMTLHPILGAVVAIGLLVMALVAFLRLFLITHVIVLEDVRGVAALKRSWGLMRGNFWRAVVILVFSFVVAIVLSLLLGFPGKILGGMIGGAAGMVLAQVFENLSTILLTPLYAIAFTLLYYDSRIRSEAFDLEMMAKNLGGGIAAPPADDVAPDIAPEPVGPADSTATVRIAPAPSPRAARPATPPPPVSGQAAAIPVAARPRPVATPGRSFASGKVCPKCQIQFPAIRPTCPKCGTRVALRPAS